MLIILCISLIILVVLGRRTAERNELDELIGETEYERRKEEKRTSKLVQGFYELYELIIRGSNSIERRGRVVNKLYINSISIINHVIIYVLILESFGSNLHQFGTPQRPSISLCVLLSSYIFNYIVHQEVKPLINSSNCYEYNIYENEMLLLLKMDDMKGNDEYEIKYSVGTSIKNKMIKKCKQNHIVMQKICEFGIIIILLMIELTGIKWLVKLIETVSNYSETKLLVTETVYGHSEISVGIEENKQRREENQNEPVVIIVTSQWEHEKEQERSRALILGQTRFVLQQHVVPRISHIILLNDRHTNYGTVVNSSIIEYALLIIGSPEYYSGHIDRAKEVLNEYEIVGLVYRVLAELLIIFITLILLIKSDKLEQQKKLISRFGLNLLLQFSHFYEEIVATLIVLQLYVYYIVSYTLDSEPVGGLYLIYNSQILMGYLALVLIRIDVSDHVILGTTFIISSKVKWTEYTIDKLNDLIKNGREKQERIRALVPVQIRFVDISHILLLLIMLLRFMLVNITIVPYYELQILYSPTLYAKYASIYLLYDIDEIDRIEQKELNYLIGYESEYIEMVLNDSTNPLSSLRVDGYGQHLKLSNIIRLENNIIVITIMNSKPMIKIVQLLIISIHSWCN